MNELQMMNGEVKTIPSYEVAEMMGREHKEVLKMLEGQKRKDGTFKHVGIIPTLTGGQFPLSEYFIPNTYVDAKGEARKCYECTKMGCDLLANKMTGEKGILFSAKYVKKFQMMEKYIKNQVSELTERDKAILNVMNAENDNKKLLALKDFENAISEPLQKKINDLEPLADKYKIFLSQDGLTTVEQFSKSLGIKGLGRNNMFKWLRENHFIDKDNKPYQNWINQRLFVMKPNGYYKKGFGEIIPLYKTMMTKKGVGYIINKLIQDDILKF